MVVSLNASVAVAVVAVVAYYLVVSWIIPDLSDRAPCSIWDDTNTNNNNNNSSNEESMWISLDLKIDESLFQGRVHPCRVFRETYEEARWAFRQAAHALEVPFAKRNPIPLSVHNLTVWKWKDSQQQTDYTTDIVVIPGNQPGLTIHSSGVHGVEGYAGSAIQVAFLQLLGQLYNENEHGPLRWRHPTIILVHAVNPVGMAHYRRVNERNVDLNRNGLRPDEWSSEYVRAHPNRDNYDRFSATLFNPASPPNIFWSAGIGYYVKAAVAVVRYGLAKLKAGMVGGQYHEPTGIFYGGKDHAEPSLRLLEEWLRDFLTATTASSSSDAVTWIDVHTGLGPFGVDTLLVSNLSDDEQAAPEMQVQHYFNAATQTDSTSASNVAQGYENVKGFINNYYKYLFSDEQKALIVTQEFGTLHLILVGRALILENAAYQHLPSDEAIDWAKRTTKPAFYPQSQRWRRMVLERGIRVLLEAMSRSVQLSKQ